MILQFKKFSNLQDVPQMINDASQYQFKPTKDVLMYDDIELNCPYKNYDKLSWLKVGFAMNKQHK